MPITATAAASEVTISRLKGESHKVGTPTSVLVKSLDVANNVTEATGTTVPTDGDAGFAVGCQFVKTNGTVASTLYINEGTASSCDFNAMETSASSVTGITVSNGLSGGGTEGTVNVGVSDSAGVGGLFIKKIALVKYDFAVDGGVAGTITLSGAPTIPDKAVVWVESYDVLTTCTSATDAATIALQLPTNGALTTAIAISDASNPWDAGVFSRIAGGLATPLTKKTTAARVPSLLVAGGENLTAGKIVFQLAYWVSQ